MKPPAGATSVAIALGSNLGDRAAHLAFAVSRLHDLLDNLRVSSWHDTPFLSSGSGVPVPGAATVLNGAVAGTTRLGARELLDALLAIEKQAGRERPHRDAARTLDLDLILYGDAVLREEGLDVPHPRFRERLFVLEPLAEIAGDWVDPVTGLTISALLRSARPS